MSLPVRGRGLKPRLAVTTLITRYRHVAPRAGAWIETTALLGGIILQDGRSPCGGVD